MSRIPTLASIDAARGAGWTVAAIAAPVALNTLTNYVNEVAGTEVDFLAVARAA